MVGLICDKCSSKDDPKKKDTENVNCTLKQLAQIAHFQPLSILHLVLQLYNPVI